MVNTLQSSRSDLIKIVLKGGTEILSSSNHRYYIRGHGYTEANLVSVGDFLVNEIGEQILVEDVIPIRRDADEVVYNLTVKDNHNYFVSESSVLVHNTKFNPASPLPWCF